jgi:bacterial/archaeal transporter family-2 protein
MITYVALAFASGLLISLSRQINGRLSLSTSPLTASFWNHIIGFGALTAVGLVIGGLIPEGATNAPWYDYAGGPIGVVFVAAGSWFVARIGAAQTALLVIAGQMVSGVVMDLLQGVPGQMWARAGGVVLIIAGMALLQGRSKTTTDGKVTS